MSFWVLLVACAPEPEPLPDPDLVTEIRVEPETITLTTGPEGESAYAYRAVATLESGVTQDLALAEWTLSNRSVGEIDETGRFVASNENGGVSWVIARYAGVEGRATLTVLYEDYDNPEGLDISGFGSGTTEPAELWLYPEDGVNIPRNTPSVTFMWRAVEGAAAYRLRFRSEVTNFTAYTAATHFTAEVETWQNLVATNAGGQLQVELAAVKEGVVYEDEPLTVTVNRMDSTGTIIYWSTSAQGLMQIPYGDAASELLTVNQTGHCVACHAVSSQGRVAYTYDGGNGAMGLADVETATEVVAADGGLAGNFKTFSPDGNYLLSTSFGALLLHDGVTGAYLWTVPMSVAATQVDWSPDGTRVALVVTPGHTNDWTYSGGSIAVMEHYGDGQFGEPWILVPYTDGVNNYYPAWSPDGEWIAFNRSTGDSYDDPDAMVWVVRADGSEDPVPLDAANQTSGLYNSWPKWGPLPDDDILWLAFSSRRSYGDVVTGAPQIWVAGFDPARAAEGVDPSWPAFWLANQDSGQNNHIPVWVDR
ncbi:MAG: PD40 domain-containing protein [Alphaproteobacteria bacterium]|nr:PD40 domain-containing protein [Alphaproteobacteria bacterium]